MLADDGSVAARSSPCRKARSLLRWQHERFVRAIPSSSSSSNRQQRRPDTNLASSLSSFLSSWLAVCLSTCLPACLPVFLSFRRYALCGAPVAPACIDRQQMAARNQTRPRAAPLRPRNPRHHHPARVTLASGRLPSLRDIYADVEEFFLAPRLSLRINIDVKQASKYDRGVDIARFA